MYLKELLWKLNGGKNRKAQLFLRLDPKESLRVLVKGTGRNCKKQRRQGLSCSYV